MVKLIVIEGQILTEDFIKKRIHEQYVYLMQLDWRKLEPERRAELWESGNERREYFKKLINQLKTI